MEEKQKGCRFANLVSVVYVLVSLWLLGAVCGSCYPVIGEPVRRILAGLEDNPVREAFSVLAEGLENGNSVMDAVSASVEVLAGEQA